MGRQRGDEEEERFEEEERESSISCNTKGVSHPRRTSSEAVTTENDGSLEEEKAVGRIRQRRRERTEKEKNEIRRVRPLRLRGIESEDDR